MRLAFRVVFVCSGNTCRSPMAAALLRRPDQPGSLSCGSRESRCIGRPGRRRRGTLRPEGAVRALHLGTSALAEHTDHTLWRRHLDFDLILTMTEGHKARILLAYPEVAAKVYTLKEYAGLDGSPRHRRSLYARGRGVSRDDGGDRPRPVAKGAGPIGSRTVGRPRRDKARRARASESWQSDVIMPVST